MNKFLKRILLGLIIWAVPFIVSFFVWDVENNMPIFGMAWFNAIMAAFFAIGFVIAAFLYFRDVKEGIVKDGWITGITWFIELLILDFLVLVLLFGMTIPEYLPMIITYLNALILSVGIGYLRAAKPATA